MTAIATDFLILVLAVIFLYGAKPAKPFACGLHEDYLSVESGNSLRGLLSIVIVLHHLAQNCSGLLLFPLFSKVGYLTVAVFFFLSGYGLMTQYCRKRNYRHHFLRRRLPTILLPYIIATLVFWAAYQLTGTPLTGADVLLGLVNGFPIVTPSWYIICLLLFYVLFRVLMSLWGKRYTGILISAGIFCILYAMACHSLGYGIWWYDSIITTVMGMAWALHEGKINAFFQKKYGIAAPALFLLFIIQYGGKILLNPYIHNVAITVGLAWLTSILFTVCILLVIMKLKLDNSLLRWLGSISLETYLYHYLFILVLRSRLIHVTNDFLYVILVIACSLVMAQAMHRVNCLVLNTYRKISR